MPQSGDDNSGPLAGKRIALVGRLASMSKREAAALVRQHGGTVAERPDAPVDLVVVGERDMPLPDAPELDRWLDGPARQAGGPAPEVISETQLFERLGMVEPGGQIHRLYTPAMLAELVGVPVAIVRRWHRRGLIVPVREVRKLPYFDFQEVAAARRLAELLAAGTSPESIERKLASLSRYLPGVERPLAQLSVIIQGKDILLRQGDGLVEPGGQMRFDFDAAEGPAGPVAETPADAPLSSDELAAMAAELEESGDLEAAADVLRAAMAAAGPSPELCFQVAELLYRLGDRTAARERYYTAVELDEDYVEARANLGCVLAELGQPDLAVAAFEGALAFHPDYADVHFHLARTLDELNRPTEAETHWRAFLALAPDSPWAEQTRTRLE